MTALFVIGASLVFGILFLLLVPALAKRLRNGQISPKAALLWALPGILVIGAVFVGFSGLRNNFVVVVLCALCGFSVSLCPLWK